jgi:hypothetical protein
MALSAVLLLAGILLLALGAYGGYRCDTILCALDTPQFDRQLSYSGLVLLVVSTIAILMARRASQRGAIPPSGVSN